MLEPEATTTTKTTKTVGRFSTEATKTSARSHGLAGNCTLESITEFTRRGRNYCLGKVVWWAFFRQIQHFYPAKYFFHSHLIDQPLEEHWEINRHKRCRLILGPHSALHMTIIPPPLFEWWTFLPILHLSIQWSQK